MNTVDTTLVILMAEICIFLLVIAVGTLFFFRHRRNKEMNTLNQFIDQLEEQATFKNKPLDHLLTVACGLDRNTVDTTLGQVIESERTLLQNVIQLLLQREMGLLGEIDKNIGRLSEPYCRLLSEMGTHHTAVAANADDDLKKINEQLVKQLEVALQTIDEITAEYTRAFSGNQTALELENSGKKMQQIFQLAERNIRQAMNHHGDSQ
jgi:hypothetical protein